MKWYSGTLLPSRAKERYSIGKRGGAGRPDHVPDQPRANGKRPAQNTGHDMAAKSCPQLAIIRYIQYFVGVALRGQLTTYPCGHVHDRWYTGRLKSGNGPGWREQPYHAYADLLVRSFLLLVFLSLL